MENTYQLTFCVTKSYWKTKIYAGHSQKMGILLTNIMVYHTVNKSEAHSNINAWHENTLQLYHPLVI